MMKHTLIKIAALFCGLTLLVACSPDDYTYNDNSIVDLSTISRMELKPNQLMVLADGKAELDLRPLLYTEDGHIVPDSRVKDDWIEYTSDNMTAIKRHFNTSDISLVGKEVTVKAKLKGFSIESQPVTFKISEPLEKKFTTKITIPVVIHIIQTTEEVEEFYSRFDNDRLSQIIEKLNNIFGGRISRNPVGVDTHITFKLAEYNPYGRKMAESGINRIITKEIDSSNKFQDFIQAQNLIWPVDKYMNIWLVSDRKREVRHFGYELSENCVPSLVNKSITDDEILEGLELSRDGNLDMLSPVQAGLMYKLQELDVFDRGFGPDVTNELVYYIGRYLGLLPTCTYKLKALGDYCEDTLDYEETDEDDNDTWYKTMHGCYFLSENIMDDPTGVHNSISKEQCIRMRWVLNNCPERSFWKSNFAFTGKE